MLNPHKWLHALCKIPVIYEAVENRADCWEVVWAALWNKTSSADRQTLWRTVTQWQWRRNWEVLERRGRPQNTCEELTGMPRTAICVYKIICFLFLSLSLLHSLWFTVHSLHMLPLCCIKYIAVKDSTALWVQHMFSSCCFLWVRRIQMRGAKAKAINKAPIRADIICWGGFSLLTLSSKHIDFVPCRFAQWHFLSVVLLPLGHSV